MEGVIVFLIFQKEHYKNFYKTLMYTLKKNFLPLVYHQNKKFAVYEKI